MVELLKQPQYKPLNVVDQLIMLFAGTQGHLDTLPVDKVGRWESEFLEFIHNQKSDVWNLIRDNADQGSTFKSDDDQCSQALVAAIEEFTKQFNAS